MGRLRWLLHPTRLLVSLSAALGFQWWWTMESAPGELPEARATYIRPMFAMSPNTPSYQAAAKPPSAPPLSDPTAKARTGTGPVSPSTAAAGVLRDTEIDGDWGIDTRGQLQPSLALRRRFDYLLLRLGEVPAETLSIELERMARRDLSENATRAVMDQWRKYLVLQNTNYRTVAVPRDPSSLAPALAERQHLRRQVLGPAWAQAFFGEEERELTEMILRPAPTSVGTSGAVAVAEPELIDRSTLDAAALQRLQAEEAAQARWASQLELTRQDVTRLRKAPELSELQRDQAIDSLIEARYAGRDRVRIRALLGLR